jgi:hypothetical protein
MLLRGLLPRFYTRAENLETTPPLPEGLDMRPPSGGRHLFLCSQASNTSKLRFGFRLTEGASETELVLVLASFSLVLYFGSSQAG